MASRVSIGRAWDEAWAFLRAEAALLLPVAAATSGAAMLLLLLLDVVPEPVAGRVPQGTWMLWLLPFYALTLTGTLATTALALKPGISVRESLTLALRRLPTCAAVVLLLGAVSMLGGVPVALVAALESARGGGPGPATALVNLVMLAFFLWLSVRLLPIWPMVTERDATPIAAFRRSFALTRGHAARLLALMLLAGVGALVVGSALLFGGGAVLTAIGRLLSGDRLAAVLFELLVAAVFACAVTMWAVVVAFLYRQLAASD